MVKIINFSSLNGNVRPAGAPTTSLARSIIMINKPASPQIQSTSQSEQEKPVDQAADGGEVESTSQEKTEQEIKPAESLINENL